ncbi:MAG: NADPH:quinone reductase [Acidimicrobiales bacterium]
MRAALYDRPGPARDVLRVAEVDRPEPGEGQVRVRLQLSGVNPTDWKTRSGATPRPIETFQIPNQDGAGVIDAVGEGVDASRVGQRVWVWFAALGQPWGTAAEWTVVPEERAVHLPDAVTMEHGASLGVPAMTAHRCLFADGPLDGRSVLVAGGAGAVGHFAIELAKFAGARVVTTVSSEEKAELAYRAGADLVVDYLADDAVDQIWAFAKPVDRIIEVALRTNLLLDLEVSGPQTVVSVYAADGPDPLLPVRACMTANISMHFVQLYGLPALALQQASRDVTAALEYGALSGLPIHRFPLEDIAAAHDAVESHVVGKVVIELTASEDTTF